jgi:outer membrane protein OmpA-like peptidoglycan-associated protein
MIVWAGCNKKVQTQSSILPNDTPPSTPVFAYKEKDGNALVFDREDSPTANVGVIHFDYNSDVVKDSEIPALIKIAQKYAANSFIITGGCSPEGSDDYNVGLGFARANAVRDWFVAYGVRGYIECNSYGETHLVSEIESEYPLNRRCEIVVK